ncbi:methionyl-tRNA formyltransferase [Anaerocolumna sedimenticola]|uniref:Methionyl-tRNA formyltransferase n=1 Tax=Anaerocolumna sedimenticola TaxID=2696063 RepID=A0A6P1TRH7_9FIRM|nr:methionyl-tRNA formyltransferase [Anaerocolumna sedimenticola]QHQ62038.1 methionyl-tRNA formyltransferase [Anaerocolumna sedimenticola]
MNIVFMGTPDLAAVVLDKLIHSEHKILAVVTQPDKPKGRGNQVQFTPVKELALQYNIPVLQPRRVKEEGCLPILKEINPEVIVVAAFGQILPKSILEFPKYGCINVHASLLPKYRGSAPIQWSIIDGEDKTGVTIMHMDAGIDTGDMIMKAEVPIDSKETGGSLHNKLAECGGALLLKALKAIEDGTAPREKQKDEESCYAKMLDKSIGLIDFNRPAIEIERFIRGLNPWPSAYTFLDGKTIKIWDADVIEEESAGIPGEIVSVTKNTIVVKTSKDSLAIKELQLEGKKRMTVDAFLRGYLLETGKILNNKNG